jgi:hypothetical protein
MWSPDGSIVAADENQPVFDKVAAIGSLHQVSSVARSSGRPYLAQWLCPVAHLRLPSSRSHIAGRGLEGMFIRLVEKIVEGGRRRSPGHQTFPFGRGCLMLGRPIRYVVPCCEVIP